MRTASSKRQWGVHLPPEERISALRLTRPWYARPGVSGSAYNLYLSIDLCLCLTHIQINTYIIWAGECKSYLSTTG